MADTKLSQLPSLPGDLLDTDIVEVVRSGGNYKATGAQLRAGLFANSTRRQKGSVNIVLGTVFYDVAFNPALSAAPSHAVASPVLAAATGELIPAAFDRSSLTASGGRIYLASAPTAAQAAGISWEVEV